MDPCMDDLGVDPSMDDLGVEVINMDDPEVRKKAREKSKLDPVARLEVLSATLDKEEFEPSYPDSSDDGMVDKDYVKSLCLSIFASARLTTSIAESTEPTGPDTGLDAATSAIDENPIKDMAINGDDTYNNLDKDRDSSVDIDKDDTNNDPSNDRDSSVDIDKDDTNNDPSNDRDNNVDIGGVDTDNNPYFRIYISDGAHVQEIYDPAKVDKLLCTPHLPGQIQHSDSDGVQNSPKRKRGNSSIAGHHTELPPTDPYEEQELQDSGGRRSPLPKLGDSSGHHTGLPLTGSPLEEEMQFSGSSQGFKRKLSQIISQRTVLPLTGPKADIVLCGYFDVIVRKERKHIDESHRDWVEESCVIPSDVVSSWIAHHLGYYNEQFELKVYCPFGSLTLDCIVFKTSRLVTVGVKWLVEGSGENGKENHATTETYICGKLEFYNSEFNDMKSVLLETPEDKAVKVERDGSIPLLRSVVAVPECSSFTVDVNLQDAITNSGIDSPVAFQVDFSKRGILKESKDVCFAGGKIVVEVTMNTNDNINYLLFGDLSEW